MFTVSSVSNYECSAIKSYDGRAFRGIAWEGVKSDPVSIRDCDHFLQWPLGKESNFETHHYQTDCTKHRSCYHVKVEGNYVNRGTLMGPLVHGNNGAYIRSDSREYSQYHYTSKEEGKTNWTSYDEWCRVVIASDHFVLIERVSCERIYSSWNMANSYSTKYYMVARGDSYAFPYNRVKTAFVIADQVREEGTESVTQTNAADWTGYTEPPRVYTRDGNYVPTSYPEVYRQLWDDGVASLTYSSTFDEYDRESTPIPLERLKDELSEIAEFVFSHASSIDPYRDYWRDVAANDAISHSYCNDGNAYEFWKDVPTFGIEVKDITQLLTKKAAKGPIKLKDVTDNYLSAHYGSRLTMSDLEKWQKAMTEYSWRNREDHCRKVHSKRVYPCSSPYTGLSDGECTLTYGLYYDPHWDKQNMYQLQSELGFDLSGQHVWELLPFSFVVDWFHNFSKDLEAVHSGTRMIKLDIYGEEVGVKYIFPTRYEGLNLVYYQRIASKFASANPRPAPQESGQWNNHWIEGAALFLSHALR